MTQYTPNLQIPYPEAGDAPRGNEQMQAIAETLDAASGIWGFAKLTTEMTTNTTGGFQPLPMVWQAGNRMSDSGDTNKPLQVEVAGFYEVTVAARYGGVTTVSPFSLSAGGGDIYGSTTYPGSGTASFTQSQVISYDVGDTFGGNVDGYSKAFRVVQAQVFARWLGPSA